MALLGRQKEQFSNEGYIIVRNLLTQEEVEVIKWRADQIASGETKHVPEQGIELELAIENDTVLEKSQVESVCNLSNLVPYDGIMRAHATNPKIVEVIANLIGPDIKLYGDRLFMKPPHGSSGKKYQQDSQSWKEVFPHNLVSCWAALDDATCENGCRWIIPRTHKRGLMGESQQQDIERKALLGELELREVGIEVQPGDCTFHHSLLLHSHHKNGSPKRCRGYATHYMSAKSKYLGRSTKPNYMLVHGRGFRGCI